jgi:hypothetical protein
MKPMKFGVILLALLLAAMAIVPVVSAGEDQKVKNTDMNRNQIAAQLWGKNISEEEYIKNVFPDLYDKMSDCQKKEHSAKRMNWPHLTQGNKTKQGTYSSDGRILTGPQLNSPPKTSNLSTAAVVPVTWGSSSISATGRSVYHKSESWIVFPPYLNVPYIGVASYLIKEENGQEILVDTAVNAQYWVNNLKAENTASVTSSGTYITEGFHLFQFEPSVCCPNEVSYYTLSNEIYVS